MASHAVQRVPFGALASLLPPPDPAGGSGLDGGGVGGALGGSLTAGGDPAGSAAGSTAAGDRDNLLRVAANALTELGAGRRLMLLVDDAGPADVR
jgi:hypothetical protein